MCSFERCGDATANRTPRDSVRSIVICITGNGYNIIEVLEGHGVTPIRIGRSFADFEASEAAPAVAGA